MKKNEMERLKVGDVIQSNIDNRRVFVVHQTFPDHVIAVRTIEIRDPEEWEKVDTTTITVIPAPVPRAAADWFANAGILVALAIAWIGTDSIESGARYLSLATMVAAVSIIAKLVAALGSQDCSDAPKIASKKEVAAKA